MTPAGLSGNKSSCPQGWTRWPPTSGAATPESTKGREPPEDKADLGEVNPEEERDIESSEARSQASQGYSDPEDNKIPLQPSAPWSEASNPEFPLRHHLRIRQPTPPRPGPCQAVCWHWEDREGSDGAGVPALQGFLLSGGRSMQSIQGGPLGALCMLWTELGQDGGKLVSETPLKTCSWTPAPPPAACSSHTQNSFPFPERPRALPHLVLSLLLGRTHSFQPSAQGTPSLGSPPRPPAGQAPSPGLHTRPLHCP